MAVKPAMALGVGILLLAAGFSPMMTATQSDAVQFTELDENESKALTDTLNATAVTINQTNATLKLTQTRTFASQQQTIAEGAQASYSIDADTLLANTTSVVTNNSTAQFRVQYPPTFGFNDQAALLFTHLDTLLALVGFILVTFSTVVIVA